MDGSAAALGGGVELLRMAWAVLVLIAPGLVLVARLRLASSRDLARALGLGTACALALDLLLATLFSALGAPFGAFVAAHAVLGAALVLFALPLARALPAAVGRKDVRAGTWLLAGALAMFALGVASTGPVGAGTDVPDHVATVRAILERGEIVPNTVFHAGGDGATPDVRKGPGHAILALLARFSGLDPLAAWAAARAFAIAGGFLAFAMLARALLSGAAGVAIAMLAYPFLVHGNAAWFLDTFLYPHNADWLLIWPAIALFVEELLGQPSRSRRGALALVSASLAALHVFAPVLLAAGVLAVAAALTALGPGEARGRAWRLAALVVGVAAPLTIVRLALAYAPLNPLHVEASETLYIGPLLALHAPEPMLQRFSAPALALALLGLLLVRRGRGARRAALSGLTLAPMLVSLNPLAGGLLIPAIGYLFVRFLGLVPFPIVAGALVTAGWARGRTSRWGSIALVVLCVLSRTAPTVALVLEPGTEGPTPDRWGAGFELIDFHTAPGATVLSDPLTSYSVPAYTGRRVVCTLDQHSSPSDSTILERLDATMRALSPYRPLREAIDACERYDAVAVLVNPHEGKRVDTFADVRHPALLGATIERFERSDAFERVGERDGFVLFAFDPAAVSPADLERERRPFPGEVPSVPTSASAVPGNGGVAAGLPVVLAPSVTLRGFELAPRRAAPGDTLLVVATLLKHAPDRPATAHRMVLRLRRVFDGDRVRFAPVERFVARLERARGGPRLEHAINRRPTDGRFPLTIWDVGSAVADSFQLVLPHDLEPGTYRSGIRVKPQRLIRNLALSDWLRPSGGIGYPLGEIEVVARRRAEPLDVRR